MNIPIATIALAMVMSASFLLTAQNACADQQTESGKKAEHSDAPDVKRSDNYWKSVTVPSSTQKDENVKVASIATHASRQITTMRFEEPYLNEVEDRLKNHWFLPCEGEISLVLWISPDGKINHGPIVTHGDNISDLP